MINAKNTLTLCILFSFSLFAQAELFQNSYLSFQKPNNWKCDLEATEWVCYSKFSKKSRPAAIILTAKEAGPNDNLSMYERHLKMPKTNRKQPNRKSKVYRVDRKNIASHTWVDALHYGSEIGSYFTRYLATTKGKLAIVVTFSGHKDHYSKYSTDFIKAIRSLKVVTSGKMPRNGRIAIRGADQPILGGGASYDNFPALDDGLSAPSKRQTPNDKTNLFIGLALILAALGFYLFKKKKS